MSEEKNEADDSLPQSLKDELKKEGRKFVWITLGVVLLVIINISISVATLVLLASRPASGQFLNNTPNLQRLRN